MLYAGLNKQKRKEISRNTGIPIEDVLELVKLSDQARIGGHKKVRAPLYHEGAFTSEGKGYCIVEGTNVGIMKMTEQYVPYVRFETKPVSSTEEVNELIQHLSG